MRTAWRRRAGRPKRPSSATRIGAPTAPRVFIALNWSPHAQRDLDELREEVGQTHKLVTVVAAENFRAPPLTFTASLSI